MTAFAARVLRTVRALGLVSPGARLGVAVSGGADSTALLLVMREVAPSLGATVDCVIHVNHGLRGAAADEDERYVEDLATRVGVAFVGIRGDARGVARERHCSVEAAGHRLRRQAFERVRHERGLEAVATGHTLDDQAETVLLRLVRGAAAAGLRGMSPRRAGVIRPLLATPRRAIEAYLTAGGVDVRDDASNRDLSIPRNRIRHELLPLLEQHYSPRVRDALARSAAHLAVDDDHFVGEAAGVVAQFEREAGGVSCPARALDGLSRPVRRRVARATLRRLGVAESTSRIVGLEAVLAGHDIGTVTIGPISVSKREGRVHVLRRSGRNRPPRCGIEQGGADSAELASGQVVTFGPWLLSLSDATNQPVSRDASLATIDADQVESPLAVRARRPGDRFRPLGAPGRRKVQDILVDRKVPRASRDTTPIVVDARGRIVWLAGQVVAHEARITATTARMLLLTLRPAGGAV